MVPLILVTWRQQPLPGLVTRESVHCIISHTSTSIACFPGTGRSGLLQMGGRGGGTVPGRGRGINPADSQLPRRAQPALGPPGFGATDRAVDAAVAPPFELRGQQGGRGGGPGRGFGPAWGRGAALQPHFPPLNAEASFDQPWQVEL